MYKYDQFINKIAEITKSFQRDYEIAEKELKKNYESQYNRRIYFIVSFTMIEAMINLMKQNITNLYTTFSKSRPDKNTLPLHYKHFYPKLTNEELSVLNENMPSVKNNGIVGTRPLFLPLEVNIKTTLRLYLKVINLELNIKYDDPSFKKLIDSSKVRNRIVHPKNLKSLEISDDELKNLSQGVYWFVLLFYNISSEYRRIVDKCNAELKNNQ